LTYGQINLVFRVNLKSTNETISLHEVSITVAQITSVNIVGMNDRILHLLTSVRLIGQVFLDQEALTPSVCPLQYIWSSRSDSVIYIDQSNNLIDISQLNEENA